MKIVASVTPNSTKFGPLLYPGELEKAIIELADFGYDGIELSLRTPLDVDPVVLFDLLDKKGLELVSIATGQSFVEDGYSLYDPDPEIREKTVTRMKGYMDMLSSGGGMVILGGIKGKLNDQDRNIQINGGDAAIDKCLDYAEKKRVTLLLEAINRYETNLFNTVESCVNFAKSRGSEYLKVLPDAFHMNIEETDMKQSLDMAGKYIGAIHCADSNRLAPGMGHINFKELLGNLSHYTGLRYLGVEVLPLPDSRSCAETAIATIRECLLKEE